MLEIKVPPVGESITEVTIAKWLKNDGDQVALDELLCELESDKATFELRAEQAGKLKIIAQPGVAIPIGTLIGSIDGAASGATASAPTKPAESLDLKGTPYQAPALGGEKLVMKVPTVGESISEVTISNWKKKEGEFVKMNEILCEIDSDKATFEIPAEAEGNLHIVAGQGATLGIGDVICEITKGAFTLTTSSSATTGANASTPAAAPVPTSVPAQVAAPVSPLAASILAEKGINPAAISGTGPGGKITKEDALKAVSSGAPAPQAAPATPATPAPAVSQPAVSGISGREQRRSKMTSLRKTVSRRLVAVKNETAMLTTFNEVDMKPIMDLRAKYKDKFKEKHNIGLGFMSFFTKACAIALKEWPAVNAFIDGEDIVYNDFVDISIAVSAPKGLVVPVIRNAENMNFAQIEQEVARLAGLARDNKLTIEQMTGGTFTITNGGVFGSMLSTPIINAPQSAILGMHNIVDRAMVVNGEIVIRPIMYVALSYDHRIIDGRESVSFLVRVKQLLEDPTRILLDV